METDERGPRVPAGDDPAPEPSEDFDEDSGDDLGDDWSGEESAGDWEEESPPPSQSWGDGDP